MFEVACGRSYWLSSLFAKAGFYQPLQQGPVVGMMVVFGVVRRLILFDDNDFTYGKPVTVTA
jgi:hypothetical protein